MCKVPLIATVILLLAIFTTACDNVSQKDVAINCTNAFTNVATQQTDTANPNIAFLKLANKEFNNWLYKSYYFGQHLAKLDSLTKTLNNKNATAIAQFLTTLNYKDDSANCELKKNDINYCLHLFKQVKDTVGILYCYSILSIVKTSMWAPVIVLQKNDTNRIKCEKIIDTINIYCNKNANDYYNLINNVVQFNFNRYVLNDKPLSISNLKKAIEIADANPDLRSLKLFLLLKTPLCYKYESYVESPFLQYCFKIIPQQLHTLPLTATSQIDFYSTMGHLYNDELKYDSAKVYYLKALDLCQWIKSANRRNFWEIICKANIEDVGNVPLADRSHTHKHNSDIDKEALINQSNILQLQKQQTQKINELLLQEKTIYTKIAIVSIISSLCFLFLIIRLFYFSKKQKQLLQFRDKVEAIISHDLQSPLFALRGLGSDLAYLIKNKKTEQVYKLANAIDDATLQMSNLLGNLLIWAKTKTHKSQYNTINLKITIAQTIALYTTIIEQEKVKIDNQINDQTQLYINQNALELLVRNWLDNTLKYAKAQNIWINENSSRNQLILTIKDDGYIAPQTLQQIKQQIKSVDVVTINNRVGLGLNLIAHFVQQEDWSVNIVTINNTNILTIVVPILQQPIELGRH